ncbi:SGNH/GDSL hydrolase family protein [Pseudarthrobacter sp. CCNWLW207]|uniref:SGNH/GDSL hydrolase family protein n=1 Tax=Pseudarthrobacter sp. CCNWLW207 TaxID=3127468 RepID=UPI003076DF2D
MGFPPGMVLNTIAFGIPLTATGKDVVTKVTVKPTSRVIWAATGQPLPEFSDSFTAEAGQLGQFQVPAVDQPGFIDSAGNAVTDFAYQISASWEYANERPINWNKNLKPLQGQSGVIDLDLVPDGPVSIPVTAPTAAMLGFNGRTGFVTLQESDLPERLSEGELSATILSEVEAPIAGSLLDGSRYIGQGDSNTQQFDNQTDPKYRSSWCSLASVLSNGALRLVKNSGVGGYNSTQLKNLFDADVLAHNPTLVSLMPGRNDGQGAGYPSEMIDYVTEAHAKCKAAGVGLFLVNTVPQGQAALAAPTGVTAQLASSIAGVLVPRTYRFKVTAGNGPVQSTPTGETLPSAAVSVVVANTTSAVRVYWDHVKGANFYGIYCETSDGSGVYGLLGYVPASASPGYSVGHRWIQSSAVGALGAEPPSSNTTALASSQQANRARINAWLSQYAAKHNIPLVDIYSKLVDPATGMFQTGLTWDGTHLNGEASKIVADAVWATVGPLLRPHTPPLMTSAADPLNLDTNGTFATGTANLPTGWVATNTPTYEAGQTTHTRAARTGFVGNALAVSGAVPIVVTDVGPNLTGVTAGDKLRVAGMIETTLATGGGTFSLALKDQAGNVLTEWKVVAADMPPRAFTTEATVPAGATSLHWEAVLAGRGPIYFGQLSILNLTTNAWLDL